MGISTRFSNVYGEPFSLAYTKNTRKKYLSLYEVLTKKSSSTLLAQFPVGLLDARNQD
jgi:hypothetical protein